LIGFGDPYFSSEQAAEAEGEIKLASADTAGASDRAGRFASRLTPRTRQVDTAGLALLPRLPDTADELKAIAISLQLDPSKALRLGKQANEHVVKTEDLSRYRIVAFATHGLVAGDIDGLTQPALALSAPSIAQVEGDGLLTADEVLGLRLDSDWVLLSACNTAAGVTAGAEALSGLGRAFFYAGTRALLVTNWPVISVAATDLVADIFKRHAAMPTVSRAEVVRQAMVQLMDGPGFARVGETPFTYAHPVFWAPYSLVGDAGGE